MPVCILGFLIATDSSLTIFREKWHAIDSQPLGKACDMGEPLLSSLGSTQVRAKTLQIMGFYNGFYNI